MKNKIICRGFFVVSKTIRSFCLATKFNDCHIFRITMDELNYLILYADGGFGVR